MQTRYTPPIQPVKKPYASGKSLTKKLFFLLWIAAFALHAQPGLWGLTNVGGSGGGTLFTTDRNGNNEQVKYNFPQTAGGTHPFGGLMTASNGKIYGTTTYGGYFDLGTTTGGTLFEFNPINHSLSIKVSFGDPRDLTGDGKIPMGVLTELNGKLYGTTYRGGKYNGGTIYAYDLDSGYYKKLWDFRKKYDALDSLGGTPIGSLLAASNGKLYGTNRDGTGCVPALYEYDPVASTMKIVTSICGGGAGSLDFVQAGNGKIYGISDDVDALGKVFSYDPVTGSFTFITEIFAGTLGYEFPESFAISSNGKLYTNMNNTNNIYADHPITLGEFDPISGIYSTVFFFDTTNVKNMLNPLLPGIDGKLYGTAGIGPPSPYFNIYTPQGTGGGAHDKGILYSFDPVSQVYTKVLDFNGQNGALPSGFMTQHPNGKIYGTTYSGGIEDQGTLFEYDPVTNNFQKIFDFIATPQSTSPQSSVLLVGDSTLYGTSMNGGAYQEGTLFSYSAFSNTFKNIFSFKTTLTGGNPTGSLIQASDHKLYGMALQGGSAGMGTIFSFDTIGNIFSKKYDFTTLSGANPAGAFLQALDGLLYGLTTGGGSSGHGVLFAFNTTTSGYTKKIDLDSLTQGAHPYGSLVLAPNNKLYGLTSSGGSGGYGTLFSYDYAGNVFTKIIDFTTTTGANPYGSLVLANDNLLYGMTSSGGANNLGTLFSFNPANNSFTRKQDLTTQTGANPQGSLWQGTTGKLYGMTGTGGTYNLGTVFEYDMTNNTLTKTLDFNWDNGASPVYGNLVEICLKPKITLQPQSFITCTSSAFQLNVTATGLPFYQWYANNQSITGANNAMLTVSGALQGNILYYCKVFNECGTLTSNIVTVTGNPLPTITGTIMHGSVCLGDPLTITGAGASILTITGGVTSGIGFVPTTSGITVYTLTGTAPNQCINTAMVTVTVNSLPTLTITGNPAICNQEPASLTASGANTYLWSNNITDSVNTVSPGSNTVYSVTGTGLNGCTLTKQIIVTVGTLPGLSVTGKTTICAGSETTLSATGANTYSWSTNASTTSINVLPTITTSYTITGTGTNGCVASKEIIVTVNSLPGVMLDLSGINNQCDTLSPIPLRGGFPEGGTYLYNSRSVINLNNSLAGEYLILYRYTDQNGCVNTATGILTSIHCTVPGICERPNAPCYCTNTCPPRFKVYTGITPNNDGRNDTWLIDSLAPENTVAVLDKWGNEVYRKQHYNNEWDGKQDGKELPSGVYYYLVENDRKRFSGTVSIIR